MKTQPTPPYFARQDRLLQEHVHDPYKTSQKLPEPSVCPVCKAVFHHGRWEWAESWPIDAHQAICQACHRTKDGYPAGVVTLTGAFALAHKTEILSLIRHHEKQENAEHPLHRIMQIDERPNEVVIRTTDMHLARRIGKALHDACKGELDTHYVEETFFVRVTWNRET
jgi:hypothetical protein